MDSTNLLWTLFSLVIISLAYFAIFVFVLGLGIKLYGYYKTPMPWPEVVTPAPETESGVVTRILGDILLFPNLFKADKLLWIGAWIFHVALAGILIRHLRYFTYPVPGLILSFETIALWLGYIFSLAAIYLFWRRMAFKRTLYVSTLPDYFSLAFLGAIAGTGLLMSYWARAYLVDVKAFLLGLMTLQPVAPPKHPLFLVHFILVCGLMIYFPFSKLLHAGGVILSPAHTQMYQIQKKGKRYVNPWDPNPASKPSAPVQSDPGKH